MQRKTTLLMGVSGLAAVLAVAGCSNNSQPSTPPTTTTTTVSTTPPATATTTTTASGSTTTATIAPKINNNAGPGTSNGTDSATADAVNAAIVRNKEMTGSRVDAVVTNGVARLTGTVQNQQQKALATTTASKVPGVTSVANKLTIDATGGVHSAPAKPKVVNHTTIINHYIPVPTSTGGSGSGSGNGNGTGSSGSSSASNGSGTSSSSASGGTGSSASSDNGGGAGNSANGSSNGNP